MIRPYTIEEDLLCDVVQFNFVNTVTRLDKADGTMSTLNYCIYQFGTAVIRLAEDFVHMTGYI